MTNREACGTRMTRMDSASSAGMTKKRSVKINTSWIPAFAGMTATVIPKSFIEDPQ